MFDDLILKYIKAENQTFNNFKPNGYTDHL